MSSNQKRNDDLEFQDITLIEESISEHLCHSSMFLNDQYDVRQSTNANNEIGHKYPMSRNQHQEDIQLSCSSTFFSDCNKATEETEFYFNESYTYLNSEHDDEIKESITTNKNEVLETTANNREFSSTHSTKYEIDTLADISHWRRFINSLLSTKHAYAVNDNKTERSEPLSWKKKIVFGSCFAGVAILLIVVLVIAISTKPNGEDNSASKISTTAYIQALMELTVNSSYTAELQNVDSSSYRLFVADFCLQIDDIYTNGTYGLGETYFGCNILSLSEGSIVVSLAIYAVNVNEETIRSQAIDIMYNHFNKSGQYLLGKFHILRQTMKLIEVTTLHLYNPPNVQRTITTKYQQTDSIPSISSTRIQTTLTGTQQITASQTSFTTMSQNFAIISMIQSSKMSTPQPCQESHLVLKVSTSIGSTFLDSTFPGQSIISMYSATEVSHMKTPTQTFSEHLSTTSRKSAYSTLLWTSVPTIAKGQLNTISSAFAEASSTTTNTFTNRTSILTTTSITEDASTDPFAVHGSWLEWGQWSQCDVTCGNGSIFRTRLCSNQLSGGDDCRGNTTSIGICVKQNCPVDGKWSIWSTWEKCSVTCGDGGSRNRTRSCSEAVPQFGGINCSGNNSDIGPCELKPCPIDGKWSIWSTWEKCSVTCGDGGSRNRTRSCSEPIPQFGGKNCLGNNLVTGPCELKPCPIDGDWSVWTEWSACNATCANGFQFRQRRCTNPEPQFGGHLCLGNSTETNTCNDNNCPVHGSWLDWGQWSKCDVTCGNGSIFRTRVCSSPMYGGDDCFGDNTDSLICIKQHCPVHGSWLEWGQWSQCDVTCGNGSIFRTRLCSNQLSGGDDCRGNTTSIGICVKQNCPVDGKWSIWSTWEKCSVTCGDGGSRNRTRSCSEAVPQFGGINCSGNNSDIGPCELKPCPIDGKWSIWSTWEKCSVTCGDGGSRNRTRSCSEPIPQFGGKNCLGNNLVTGPCELKPCPIDGDWSVWSEWSACNATCANGFQFRQRRCTNPEPQFGGHLCLGNCTETNTCNDHNCPVHGSWLDWGQWSKCDVTCGNGSIFRTRVCSSPMYGGDDCFGDNTDSLICIKQHCPVDGEWSSWSTWEKCSVTCGENGSRNRTRSCTNPFPQFGGINCAGNSIDTGPCEDEPCPINGEWTEWGPWSRCSITCGSGYKSRTRNCTDPPPQYGGYFCVGFPKSFTDCNENQCTVQGYWTTWSTWEECSVTCGGGTRIKSRSCVNQEVLDDVLLICLGDKIEQDICNDNFCPVDGQWSEWSEWSQCSVTCGGGTKTKHRECENPKPQYGGVQCMGNSTESIACNIYNCPGGSCTNIITYVFNGPIRFVCTISGMLLVDLITIKQNNHTIAIINDSGEVKYFNTDDRTISVIYNEIVTVSIMFQNITCTDEGSYVLHLQDKTLNCVEIKGVIIVQVRPTNPVFYVNPGQLKRLPYKLEDNEHWCFADVGKPYGQLVLEMQPFNFTEFVEIPSLDRLIVTNSSYQVGCSKFQNITFVLNFTFAIEHGKLRCRVKSDETVQGKNIAATEVDLSSWERNTCTDVSKSIYDGTATITCTLNRTNDYDEIDIFKIYHGEIQNISKINRSGNITNVSSLQIRTTLDLKSVVSIVFLNVSCEDEGYYRLIIIKASTVVATVTGSLMPLRRPMKPTLLINPNVVMGMSFPDQGHVCFGNVGYPPGEFALDLLILFEGKYNYFEITNDLIIKQNDIRFNQNCEVYQNLTFELNTQNDQLNNRTLRCRVKHSWYQETIATEDLLTFIPKDICKCNTKMSGIRRGHPGRCDHYVECVNMTIPIGRACPIGQCRNSLSGVCFNDCSAYTCQMPVPIDFCDSITALQTLSTTPSTTEQSIYKYIQCTDSIATFNNNTAVIKCSLTNTTFRFINITKTTASEHQWIGTINYDKVAVLSNMSIDLNITVVVRLNELTIKFGSVQCDLYGIYTITISDEYGIDTVNTSLKILRKPKQPKLQMNPDMVINLGFYRQGNEHICIGDVGEPPGQLVVEIQNNNSSGFVPVDNKYLEIQSKQFKSQTCRNNTMIIVFGMLFTPEMDGGRIRCRVSEAEYWGEKEVVADTRDLLLIPDNICQCNKYIRATRGHPKVCDVFVQCSNYTIPEGIQCPPESCRNSITGTCGKNCSSEVCQTPVPKDFCS